MAEKLFGEMPSLAQCEMLLLGTVLFLAIYYGQRHQRHSIFWELCLFAAKNVLSVMALISCCRLQPHRGGGMEAVPFNPDLSGLNVCYVVVRDNRGPGLMAQVAPSNSVLISSAIQMVPWGSLPDQI